jgi:hypothetical protein
MTDVPRKRPDLKAAVQPCFQFREEIDRFRSCLKVLPRQRDGVDNHGMELVDGISMSVAGNPQFGQDCLLYARLGYIPKSARRKRRAPGELSR